MQKELAQMNFQKQSFFNNLGFWGVHCSCTALPSFLIAGIYLELFNSAASTLAMVTGVFIFILGYASLSTSLPLLREQDSIFSRALRMALKIRVGLSILGLFGLFVPFILIFHPDYWAGVGAKMALQTIQDAIDTTTGYYNLTQNDDFSPILLWTLIEGVILSGLLFLIAFLCQLAMKARRALYPRK